VLIEGSHDIGLFVAGSSLVGEGVLIRRTLPVANGLGGRGVSVQSGLTTGNPATVTLSASQVEDSRDVGVLISGADALIETTVVRGTAPAADGWFGRGVNIQALPNTEWPSHATVRGSRVELNHEAGVFVYRSDATVQTTLVRQTLPSPHVGYGDGLVVLSTPELAALVHLGSGLVQESARAGVANFGSVVSLASTAFDCNAVHLNGEHDFELLGYAVSLAYAFDDRGGNACGCGPETVQCTVLSAGFAPPTPIE
jgi:hypothetical protein